MVHNFIVAPLARNLEESLCCHWWAWSPSFYILSCSSVTKEILLHDMQNQWCWYLRVCFCFGYIWHFISILWQSFTYFRYNHELYDEYPFRTFKVNLIGLNIYNLVGPLAHLAKILDLTLQLELFIDSGIKLSLVSKDFGAIWVIIII